MRPLITSLFLLLPILASGSARADDSLYQAWGGKPGIRAVMDDFVPRLKADPRIRSFFAQTNARHLAEQLTEQLCELSGGPCRYEGPDMKTAHEGMQVRRSDFNALVEQLQAAMAARGIPFSAQNRMLARLAPMHRDIVE
ncbi:MAG: group 1 truncated hemoglobin [Burkholderiales bacterium]|nr:group 1 truncated hemoglobin [Burkholderiales bacterium]